MITFLFWNLNKKLLYPIVARLATKYSVDVLIFAESSISPSTMLTALNSPDQVAYHYAPSLGCEKIEIYTKFSDQFIRPVVESDRLTIRHLQLPGLRGVLVGGLHFPSKNHWDDDSQALECIELVNLIQIAEKQVGHSRTVLVGDFNMNPFENGVVGANGLHAVMSRAIAERRTRIVGGKQYSFFYNPMWSLFGDASSGPPGTFYYSSSTHKVFFWNMFDQVLVRPDLLESFSNDDVEIIDNDGITSLLSIGGLPNSKAASDHLPLLFKLRL